jgi:outer membrane protein OmpA-like peptidoglycan-associated protein/tetratricopeptide (TPR) repeat protein
MFRIIYCTVGYKDIIKVLFAFVLFILSFEMSAQTNKKVEDLYTEAQKQFSSKNYSGTIKICNQILSEESGFKDAHLLLADVYSKLDSVDLEILHLNKAGEIGREWDVVFRLGEAHYKKSDYSEALRYYNIYSDYKYITEKRQFLLACKIASCRFAIHPTYKSDELTQQKAGNSLNTANEEYWPATSQDGKKLVFTRLSKDPNLGQQEDFYMAGPDSLTWNIIKPISGINTLDNEGVQTLSDSSKIMFFTACDHADGLGDCDIYFIKFKDGKWSSPVNAGSPLNSEYWEAQPAFSSASGFLYFSSNRKGGIGNKDIWRTELLGFSEMGLPKWKLPVNMGNMINTTGDEIAPFIHPNNRNVYFVSDVHAGIGGMDLFTAEIDELGNTLSLNNAGYPVNTYNDELGLTISSIGGTNYFSASRMADKGLEIFTFNLDSGLVTTPVSYVKVKVADIKTKLPVLAEVKLETQPIKPDKFQMQETNENGETMFCLQLNRNFVLSVSQPGYLFFSTNLKPDKKNSINEPNILDVKLEPIEIGAEVQLYNIYYETDSFRILSQSEPELQNLVSFLKNNSDLKIEIQGHTDSSGNAEANQILSERRAKSVVEYLTRNGIKTNRLKFGGYGDKVPIATNETIEGRMLNRRTTIKILEK